MTALFKTPKIPPMPKMPDIPKMPAPMAPPPAPIGASQTAAMQRYRKRGAGLSGLVLTPLGGGSSGNSTLGGGTGM